MTSVSCASSASNVTGLNKSTPKNQGTENRSKSCNTSCTSNSSCFFKRRKPMNPLAYTMRPTHHKTNPVKQRVMSAKLLKLRQLQSQLNDANYHLAEYEDTNADLPRLIHSHEEEIRVLTEKNRALKRSVKELTDQLRLREEELSKAREQLSHLERLNRDKHLTEREKLMEKLEDYKIKLIKSEDQVSVLNRKLMLETKTSKQRLNAEIVKCKQAQRELLSAFEEIDRLTAMLETRENTVRPRNPKFMPESISMATLKNFPPARRNFSSEKLNSVQNPVSEVKLQPIKGNNLKKGENRRQQNGFRAPMENIKQRLSGIPVPTTQDPSIHSNLSSATSVESRDTSGTGSFKSRPTSSLKLEKLPAMTDNQTTKQKMRDGEKALVNGMEGERKVSGEDFSDDEQYLCERDMIVRYDSDKKDHAQPENERSNSLENSYNNKGASLENYSEDEDLADLIQKMKKGKEEEDKLLQKLQGRKRKGSDQSSTSESLKKAEEDIEQMAETLDSAIQKVAQTSQQEFDKNLSNVCSEVLSNVKSCSQVIEAHKDSLRHSKQDTDVLLETFLKIEKNESKLKKSFFNGEDDMEFVKEILNEERKFQAQQKVHNSTKDDVLEKKSMVNIESKRKLLATLRAIDNGDSVESIEEPKQGNVIKEIFGGH
ncbi:CAP-Gly domain-containing linker protein 1 isoform X2 [Anthonomus grandis grandis]|uniref:CAP-Gly domain-containing linker protein 1 isoform X2 n=1 Tax=Anthonomus grandis grandis TaxID=2921223 RepID=UPI0021659B82|nr:CAP-Gly domain-containing linker protein 1 isoform X2 [Anthonomus grandis grandis]